MRRPGPTPSFSLWAIKTPQVEVCVDSAKKVLSAEKGLSVDAAGRAPPPLVVASLSLKTQINPSSHQHEVRGGGLRGQVGPGRLG
jgi:hypothetical protein